MILKDKIILDKDEVNIPHRLHKMGWIELAGLAEEIRTETKIVFFVRRHVFTNISQSDVVQRPLLVAGALEEAEHLVGRAARRVVAHEHAAQDRHGVLCS